MIEEILYDYLTEALDVPVSFEVPKEQVSFVVVEKTGSGKENQIKTATVAIQSYAESLYSAAVLNDNVIEAMESLAEESTIAGCWLNTDYNFSDPTTKQYRYQAVFDIKYY